MKINGREIPIKTYREWNKRFVRGEQYLEITPMGEIDDYGKQYFWEERESYNVIITFVERAKLLCKDITEDQLYGVNGLVDRLRPFQIEYNNLHNTVNSYLKRVANPSCVVEDGSIDIDNLEDEGIAPGKVLVYRQGANSPSPFFYKDIDLTKFSDHMDSVFVQMHRVTEKFIEFIKEKED